MPAATTVMLTLAVIIRFPVKLAELMFQGQEDFGQSEQSSYGSFRKEGYLIWGS